MWICEVSSYFKIRNIYLIDILITLIATIIHGLLSDISK